MNISRRYFLKNGGIAMLGMASLPSFLQRAVAGTAHAEQKENGRAVSARRDGRPERCRSVRRAELLPHAAHRSRFLSHSASGAGARRIDLDGFFGLHPSLAAVAAALPQAISSRSSTPSARPIPRARISTRRISWSPARRA